MSVAPSSAFLSRLRASVKLSAFVLLVFALKIGAAAACAGHDFADLGLGSGTEHPVSLNGDWGGDDPPGEEPDGNAGDCAHVKCHASAILPVGPQLVSTFSSHLPSSVSGLSPSASPGSHLRPPIA
jgi:hypothetical protein